MARKRISREEYLAQYVHQIAGIIRLGGWLIDVRIHKPTSDDDSYDAHAETTIADHRPAATIIFYPPFWQSSARDKTATIAHELGHCMIDPPISLILKAAEAYLPSAGRESVSGLRDHITERYLVDELSLILAPLLPPWDYDDEG